MCSKLLSCVLLLVATPWTVALQATFSVGLSRQEYWSEFPCLPPGYLPDPGIEPTSLCLPHWQMGSLPLTPSGKPLTNSLPSVKQSLNTFAVL